MQQRSRRTAATLSLVPDPAPSPRERPKPLLLCLTHLRWDFVWQRPQHLLTRACRDYDVVVIEEPIWRQVDEPTLEVTVRRGGVRVGVPVLPEGRPVDAIAEQRHLLDGFLTNEPGRLAVVWYYTPMAFAFGRHLETDCVVYDNMDELSGFLGASPDILANEAQLFERADVVFTGGMSLFEAKRGRHPNIHGFPSSIDAAHFGQARDREAPEPEDQAAIPDPRIGFFGVIDERMDVGFVERLAALRPDWQLVMIGPVVKIDPASLPRAGNIHWLGPKDYGELPAYLAGWDAGFMPFALNDATRFISPTKTPEFLAAGLPVLSTPIPDVERGYGRDGLVEIVDTPETFVARASALLAEIPSGWREKVDARLATDSWDRTWSDMDALIRHASRSAGTRSGQSAA